jgi:hypothetical protein
MLELPQYSSIEIRGTSYIYLNIDNYEKEEICINVAGNGTQRSSNGETEYYLNIEFNYYFSNTNIFYKYATNVIKKISTLKKNLNRLILIKAYIYCNKLLKLNPDIKVD